MLGIPSVEYAHGCETATVLSFLQRALGAGRRDGGGGDCNCGPATVSSAPRPEGGSAAGREPRALLAPTCAPGHPEKTEAAPSREDCSSRARGRREAPAQASCVPPIKSASPASDPHGTGAKSELSAEATHLHGGKVLDTPAVEFVDTCPHAPGRPEQTARTPTCSLGSRRALPEAVVCYPQRAADGPTATSTGPEASCMMAHHGPGHQLETSSLQGDRCWASPPWSLPSHSSLRHAIVLRNRVVPTRAR